MHHRRTVLCGLFTLTAWTAEAQRHAPSDPGAQAVPAERTARRFPQPVRAGDLLGRQVLRPIEAQHVLGRISALVRLPDGAVLVVVNAGGLLGFGTRPVAVPLDAIALLGEHVALIDLTPQQLGALPDFDPAGAVPVPPRDTLRVGLTRPFH